MNILILFIEFFKVGIFSYGGGLAMLPLLQETALDKGWVTVTEFADLIAISQSTPGPIAINMATYIGFSSGGVFGALVASIAVILPGFILAIIVATFLQRFNEHPLVKSAFIALKAAVLGLVCTAIVQVALVSLYTVEQGNLLRFYRDIDFRAIAVFLIMILGILKFKKHPIVYIVIAGVAGAIIW
ncbi:chromate transporter [Natranaerovirga pectinivora]|uniref:Chromate transporter n=1 Tax=Natranaerovirga pectinivora TaxID=682400 RepID=A0A4R3MK11_9FIRM|nr:chromate transporter [Natranaerovirga pectinivora]TCT14615.1 chromate transporter [Natranaerovirga pectinivora]